MYFFGTLTKTFIAIMRRECSWSTLGFLDRWFYKTDIIRACKVTFPSYSFLHPFLCDQTEQICLINRRDGFDVYNSEVLWSVTSIIHTLKCLSIQVQLIDRRDSEEASTIWGATAVCSDTLSICRKTIGSAGSFQTPLKAVGQVPTPCNSGGKLNNFK